MSRRVLFVLMLVCALAVLMPRAWAQWPPETHPTDQSRDIVMTWDRSAVPGDVELWAPRTVLGFSHDVAMKYGQIHVVCGSASDPVSGKCPTEGCPPSHSGNQKYGSKPLSSARGFVRTFAQLVMS